jgi:predicted Zn-dependent peptidase
MSVKTHTYKNGFEVVYQKSPQSIPITSICIFCKVGAIHEKDGARGISHFVEHMCFKGTEKLRKTRNLYLEYNKVGAYFNAFTNKQLTGYIVKCGDEDVEHCLSILEQSLLHSIFPKKEYEKEKHVIVEESIRLIDNSNHRMEVEIEKIYFKGSAYENPIDSITYHKKHISHDELCKWYDTYYVPGNMVLSIVSNIPFKSISKQLDKLDFSKISGVIPFMSPQLSLQPISCKADKVRMEYIHKKGTIANTITIGFRTCAYRSQDIYTFFLIQSVLNGFSGKLFTQLRSDKGLTYRSKCNVEFFEHSGYLLVYVQSDPTKLIHGQTKGQIGVIPTIIQLLNYMKHHGVTQEDVELAKAKLRGYMLRNMESIDTFTQHNGMDHILLGEVVPYDKLYNKYIADLTKKVVDAAIKKYFVRENMLVAVLYDKEIPKKQIDAICNQFN